MGKRQLRRRKKKIKEQMHLMRMREKYGPLGKAAPVVRKTIERGELNV